MEGERGGQRVKNQDSNRDTIQVMCSSCRQVHPKTVSLNQKVSPRLHNVLFFLHVMTAYETIRTSMRFQDQKEKPASSGGVATARYADILYPKHYLPLTDGDKLFVERALCEFPPIRCTAIQIQIHRSYTLHLFFLWTILPIHRARLPRS